MKRLSLLLCSIVLLGLIAVPAYAQNEVLMNQESSSTSKYIVKDGSEISEVVENDVIYAGKALVINADVGDNVIFAGGSLEINGTVSGDVLFIGATLVLNGNVSGDVRVAGGTLVINSSQIDGDLFATGSQVYISSRTTVVGEKKISGEKVDTNSTQTPNSVEEANSAYGDYNTKLTELFAGLGLGLVAFSLIMKFILIVGSIISGYLILRLFPQYSDKSIETLLKNPGKSIIAGIVTFVVGFFTIFLLIFSVIGLHTLFVASIFAILAFMLASVYTKYAIGLWIVRRMNKDHTGRFIPLVIGIILVEILLMALNFIPIIGWFFVFVIQMVLMSWGVGALVYNKYQALK